MERPPFLAMPYPLDEYLDSLPGDYGKVARRTLRATRRERGTIDGIELDAGEALIDERSEKLWGGLALDRDVSAAGRRALVRRVLERLERDGIIARRAAQARGPKNSPGNGPRNGPTPTVVRFLKFRDILWREPTGTAQETAQAPAQETAQERGPVLPGKLPDPPSSLRSEGAPAARRQRRESTPAPEGFQRVVRHWFEAWERAGRGKHATLTQAEGAMLKTLLRELGPDDLEARIDRAFGDAWFLERGDLGLFRKQVQRFAPPGSGADGRRAVRDLCRGRLEPAPDEAFIEGEYDLSRIRPPGDQGAASLGAWRKLLAFAAGHVQREGLRRALGACEVQALAGELVVTPPDEYEARRLADPDCLNLPGVAAAVIPGVLVRMVEPLARAAGGAP